MAKGSVGKHELNHIPVYTRATTPTPYGKLGFWIKTERLVEVDQALEKLCQAYPDQSLSNLICEAVVYYARKTDKQSKKEKQ